MQWFDKDMMMRLFVAMLLGACSLHAFADLKVYTPYLQNVGSTEATIMFQTDGLATSRVEFWTDSLNRLSARQLLAGQEVVHSPEHSVRLTNLTPGTKYYYRVVGREILENHAYSKRFADAEVATPIYSFSTPPRGDYDFTVLVFNDIHSDKPTIEHLAQLAAETPHDLIVFNGDCLSEPASREHAIGQIQTLVEAFGLHSTPALFIRGNHEIRNAYSSGMPSLFDRFEGQTYGALTLGGDTRLVVLDCGEDKPDDTWVYYGLNDFDGLRQEQADFLRKELASKAFKRARHRVLLHHIPLWGNADKFSPCTDLWGPLLCRQAFDFDVAGHNHEALTIEPDGSHRFPVYIGGGPTPQSATMIVISRRGSTLTLTVK